MSECEALPIEGGKHNGPAAEYVRICPAGHLRRGHACNGCTGNGAIICNECEGDKPAIMIPAPVFDAMQAGRITELEQLAADMIASFCKTQDGHRARAGQVQIRRWEMILAGGT